MKNLSFASKNLTKKIKVHYFLKIGTKLKLEKIKREQLTSLDEKMDQKSISTKIFVRPEKFN